MRIHITSVDFDPQGRLTVDALPSSEIRNRSRRVSRVQTLDLGVAVNDRGFAHGDRTFIVRWLATAKTTKTAAYITQTHGRVRVATDEGVFEAMVQDYTEGRECALTLLITERLGP